MQAPTYWLLNNAWLKSFQPTDRFLRKMGACLGAHFCIQKTLCQAAMPEDIDYVRIRNSILRTLAIILVST